MANGSISGMFPIQIDKGTPGLRCRGEWNEFDEYVYNDQFRDYVVINAGLPTEDYYIVKNRWNVISGADKIPPNDIYWQKSEKISFLWAGAVKADMIDVDNLIVSNLSTNINKTEDRIEISKELNSISMYEKDKLRVLIAPKTAENMESMVDEVIYNYDITINQGGVQTLIRSGNPTLSQDRVQLSTISSTFSDGQKIFTSNNTVVVQTQSNVKDIKINIPNISLSLSNTSLLIRNLISSNGLSGIVLDRDFYYDYQFFRGEMIYMTLSLRNQSTNSSIDIGTIQYKTNYTGTVGENDNINLQLNNIFLINNVIIPGSYSVELKLSQKEQTEKGVLVIRSKSSSQFKTILLEHLSTYLQNNPMESLLSLAYISNKIILTTGHKGQLIGINNNSFYVYSHDTQYFKLLSKNEKLTHESSFVTSIERTTFDGNTGMFISKTRVGQSMELRGTGSERKSNLDIIFGKFDYKGYALNSISNFHRLLIDNNTEPTADVAGVKLLSYNGIELNANRTLSLIGGKTILKGSSGIDLVTTSGNLTGNIIGDVNITVPSNGKSINFNGTAMRIKMPIYGLHIRTRHEPNAIYFTEDDVFVLHTGSGSDIACSLPGSNAIDGRVLYFKTLYSRRFWFYSGPGGKDLRIGGDSFGDDPEGSYKRTLNAGEGFMFVYDTQFWHASFMPAT